jgi:hypothetical protein
MLVYRLTKKQSETNFSIESEMPSEEVAVLAKFHRFQFRKS